MPHLNKNVVGYVPAKMAYAQHVSGVFDKIRRIGKDCVADTTKNIQERRTYGDLNECVLGHMAHHMRLCLMRPTGEPRPDAPSIQKLLDLVKEQLT